MSADDLMSRLDEILDEEATQTSFADRVVANAEEEFGRMGDDVRERNDERKELTAKKAGLTRELRALHNVKGTSPRARKANERMALKRKTIRGSIAVIDVRLGELEREENGKKM